MSDGLGRQAWGHLRAWDLVLTIDVMVLVFAITVIINVTLLEQSTLVVAGGPTVLAGAAFAKWRAGRYTEAPPPPTDNVVLRALGLVLLSVGGLLSLIGAAIAAGATYSAFTSAPGEGMPLYGLPVLYLPLIAGHALALGGAKVRSPGVR